MNKPLPNLMYIILCFLLLVVIHFLCLKNRDHFLGSDTMAQVFVKRRGLFVSLLSVFRQKALKDLGLFCNLSSYLA